MFRWVSGSSPKYAIFPQFYMQLQLVKKSITFPEGSTTDKKVTHQCILLGPLNLMKSQTTNLVTSNKHEIQTKCSIDIIHNVWSEHYSGSV